MFFTISLGSKRLLDRAPHLKNQCRWTDLRLAAQNALEQVIELRGASGASESHGSPGMSSRRHKSPVVCGKWQAGASGRFTADSLRVAEPMRPVFDRLIAGLTRRGLLEWEGDGHRPTTAFLRAADSAKEILRSFISNHSGHLSEGLLCAANCSELGPILRGEKDAVQVLFAGTSAELLDQFYGEGLYTSHWLAAICRSRAGSRPPSARGPRTANPGSRRRHGRIGSAGAAAS